jgi:hypothetical protein
MPKIHCAGADYWYALCICCGDLKGPYPKADVDRMSQVCFNCQCLQRAKEKQKHVDNPRTNRV